MAKTEVVKSFEKVERISNALAEAVSELKYEMHQQAKRVKAKSAAAGGK